MILATRNNIIFIIFIIIVLMLLFMASLSIGPYTNLTFTQLFTCIIDTCDQTARAILDYRIARTIAATIVGAGLAASGLTVQYVLRNPLADPYLLGVSSGAAFGVILSYTITDTPSPPLLFATALILGIIAFAIVLSIGYTVGGSPTSLIVVGVSVSYALSGATIILMLKLADKLPYAFSWLFGTVAYPLKTHLKISIIITLTSVTLLLLLSNKIYTFILGDEVSESLGVPVKKTRIITLGLSGIIAAALVALAGPVGFLGLAAPWLSRMLVGSKYSISLTVSIIIGSILAIFSDIVARLLISPSEIPLTAITAIFGGPLLFYLTRKTGW